MGVLSRTAVKKSTARRELRPNVYGHLKAFGLLRAVRSWGGKIGYLEGYLY